MLSKHLKKEQWPLVQGGLLSMLTVGCGLCCDMTWLSCLMLLLYPRNIWQSMGFLALLVCQGKAIPHYTLVQAFTGIGVGRTLLYLLALCVGISFIAAR